MSDADRSPADDPLSISEPWLNYGERFQRNGTPEAVQVTAKKLAKKLGPVTEGRQVAYMGALAITTCDCGRELYLAQRFYGRRDYTGGCDCGREWRLLDNQLAVCGEAP